MRVVRLVSIAVTLVCVAAPPARASVRVAFQDARVSISAHDATVAEILAEWARGTGVTIVNADKLPRERVTIELQDVTEREALDVLLRTMGGYIARRRAGGPWLGSLLIVPPSAPIPPQRAGITSSAPAAASYYAPTEEVEISEPVQAASAAPYPQAPTFTTTVGTPIGALDDAPSILTPEQQAASEVAQVAIRSRHALETVNPRDFVVPKRGGS